jgi:hypothetical protein
MWNDGVTLTAAIFVGRDSGVEPDELIVERKVIGWTPESACRINSLGKETHCDDFHAEPCDVAWEDETKLQVARYDIFDCDSPSTFHLESFCENLPNGASIKPNVVKGACSGKRWNTSRAV